MTQRIKICFLVFACFALFGGCSTDKPPAPATTMATTAKSAGRWDSPMAEFDKQDQLHPPPPHPILFVGSSTIRFWKTSEAFPGLPVINRGFGGSQIDDVN